MLEGKRKLLVTLVGIGSANWALYLDKLDGTTWATMVGGMVATFMALNMLRGKQAES